MKALVLTAAVLLASPLCLLAQDEEQPIHVKVIQRDDGTHVSVTTDPSTHTRTEETLSNKDKLLQKVVYQLNDQNQATSGIVYTPAGDVVYKLQLDHDAAGNVTQETDYSKTGEVLRRVVFHYYGPNGQLSGMEAFDGQGNPIKKTDGAAVKDKKKSIPRINR